MATDLVPFEEVWPRIAAELEPLGTEQVALDDAEGRVLREPLRAAWDLPRFDAAAMDGYAVRAADCTGEPPFRLRLAAGAAYAGPGKPPPLAAGEAMPIGTGGVVPDGADAVAVREISRLDGDAVIVERPVAEGDNIRRRGEELRAGDELLAAGTRLDAVALAAAAAAGAGTRPVTVGVRPRVGVVATGSELVPPDRAPGPGQIVDTNRPLLERLVRRVLGTGPAFSAHAGDDADETARTLGDALEATDLLVVTGGVSVGDRDYVRRTLEERLGATRLFWRVAQKPGKPLYVAQAGARWIVGLPGNPAAVIVHATTVLVPLIRALEGAAEPLPRRLPVRLAEPQRRDRRRTLLRWATLHVENGALWARILPRCGSHMISDLARADVLVIIPPGEGELAPGDSLDALLLER
ncbi:MAG: molybdopterin molybdotransferase MoeA [Acidobacteriota bacterium]